MKRERIPVIASGPNGESHVLGHVSRVTRSCLAAFLQREGFDALAKLGGPRVQWDAMPPVECVGPDGYGTGFSADGWRVTVSR